MTDRNHTQNSRRPRRRTERRAPRRIERRRQPVQKADFGKLDTALETFLREENPIYHMIQEVERMEGSFDSDEWNDNIEILLDEAAKIYKLYGELEDFVQGTRDAVLDEMG